MGETREASTLGDSVGMFRIQAAHSYRMAGSHRTMLVSKGTIITKGITPRDTPETVLAPRVTRITRNTLEARTFKITR